MTVNVMLGGGHRSKKRGTMYQMTVMIQGGLDVTPVITHRFRYDEFERGFEVLRSGESGKVVLDRLE